MKNTLKIDFEKRAIIMDRTFAKNVENTNSEEYAHLQQVRKDYPTFAVVRKQIKRNANKECYKGLTYDYMRTYIFTHEPKETKKDVLEEMEEMILISQCHSKAKRYPVIKNWFLNKYPEIKKFGMETPEEEKVVAESVETNEVALKKAS